MASSISVSLFVSSGWITFRYIKLYPEVAGVTSHMTNRVFAS
ncbi:unnamed protein product [Schistosoma curassoni]|uniref:Secreted protein n=1 Tax=Schistosoma curassoni TaxID=6186 RepID=A0A183KDF9_9TREM|nr:unnamed protein product [Schistosoma curassoni]